MTAECKLLVVLNQEMNALEYMISAILLKDGAKQSAFARLNATFDCLSYMSTLKISEEFGKDWNIELLSWAKCVDTESNSGSEILQQKQMARETIDFLEDIPSAAVNRTLEMADLETTVSKPLSILSLA